MSISEVDLKNAFLATPITKEGKINMRQTLINQEASVTDFLNNCYVEPNFENQDKMVIKINSEESYSLDESQDYELFLSSENDYKKYVYEIKRRSSAFQKEIFEKSLLGASASDVNHQLNRTVYLIEGPAGCGKTTYAYKLIHDKFEFDYRDIETATQKSCWFFDNFYDFPEDTFDPIDAMKMLILSCIHTKIAKSPDENENDYRERLSLFCTVYNQYFVSKRISTADTPEYRSFFDTIQNYVNLKSDYSQLTEILHAKIDGCLPPSNDDTLIPEIKYLLGVLLRIYFCWSRLGEPKTILFFDNFERYIVSEDGKPYINIYDSHLQKILISIYSISEETENIIFRIFNELNEDKLKYETSFGILIAMRESTIDMMKRNSAFMKYFEQNCAENMPTYVNITNWYDYDLIIKKKIKYFTGKDADIDLQDNTIVCALNNILNDISKSKWCLRDLFQNIFNNNFRRFSANLSEAFCQYKDILLFFNKMWIKASVDKNYLKHLCRKLILRLVLDYMQNNLQDNDSETDGFFDKLMTKICSDDLDDKIEKSTYARRILTFLDNVDKGDGEEVSFPDLIKLLLHDPIFKIDSNERGSNVPNDDPRIDDIAEILTVANESSKLKTNGVELVTLNIDTVRMGRNTLADEMKLQWERYIKKEEIDRKNFNIKITPAGSIFALLFPCFEYFACRYHPKSIPLFMIEKEEEREKLLFGNSSKDIKLFGGVVNHTLSCVDNVIRREAHLLSMGNDNGMHSPQWLYKYSSWDRGVVHPVRILIEHINYLSDYKNFLSNDADERYETELYKKNKKTTIENSVEKKGVVDRAIDIYKQKLEDVVKQYRKYVALGKIPDKKYVNN